MKKILLMTLLGLYGISAYAAEQLRSKAVVTDSKGKVRIESTPNGAEAKKKQAATKKAAKKKNKNQQSLKTVRQAGGNGVGLSYSIMLKDNSGILKRVKPTRNFKSGERFKIDVRVTEPSYLYVVNLAPNGSSTTIYPQDGQDNLMWAGKTISIPAKGYFAFDDEPGKEFLLIYASKQQVTDLKDVIDNRYVDVVDKNLEKNCDATKEYGIRAKGLSYVNETMCAPGIKAKGVRIIEDGYQSDKPEMLLMMELKHN